MASRWARIDFANADSGDAPDVVLDTVSPKISSNCDDLFSTIISDSGIDSGSDSGVASMDATGSVGAATTGARAATDGRCVRDTTAASDAYVTNAPIMHRINLLKIFAFVVITLIQCCTCRVIEFT